jgi:hypothetical protein
MAVLAGFWCAVFSESLEINGSFGKAHVCPSLTEINENLRILNEMTGKFVTCYFKKVLKIMKLN